MNLYRRNTWHVVLLACLLGLTLLAAARPAVSAASTYARPATPQEVKVFEDAAAELRAAGLALPDSIAVYVTGPLVLECGQIVAACAYPTALYIAPDTAAGARAWRRHTGHKTPNARRRSYRNCGAVCPAAIQLALHEMVHVSRMTYRPYESWLDPEFFFEEGIADAVALDRMRGLIYRVTGVRATFPAADWAVYPAQTAAIRAAYPTQADRLAAARTTERPTLTGDVNS